MGPRAWTSIADTAIASVARKIPTSTRPPVRLRVAAPATTATPVAIAPTASATSHRMSTPTASSRASDAGPGEQDSHPGRKIDGDARLRRSAGVSAGLRRRARAIVGAALREHDREPAEQEQRPRETAVGPEVRLRDQRDECDATSATPARSQGRSRWRRSASDTIESLSPSSGITSPAAT